MLEILQSSYRNGYFYGNFTPFLMLLTRFLYPNDFADDLLTICLKIAHTIHVIRHVP